MTPLVETYSPSIRGDAMLLTHGREGTERMIAAALLIDAVLAGAIDLTIIADRHTPRRSLFERRRLTAGQKRTDAPAPISDLRERVRTGPADTPAGWIDRATTFAPAATAAELVAAGAAAPLTQCRFTLSIDARAESAARARIPENPALAGVLHAAGLTHLTGFLPPATHVLPPAAKAILAALR
jgi:hypothetical protein